MKIRSFFAALAGAIVLIPVALITLGTFLWAASRAPEPLPEYRQLPAGVGTLTDQASWNLVRATLANRPPQADILVFDPDFRLIWTSMDLSVLARPGQAPTLQEAVQFLRGGDKSRDILLYQPGPTDLWVVQVQPGAAPTALQIQRALLMFTVTLLGVLVVAVGVSLALGRAHAASVVRLEKAARNLAEGDLGSPVPPQRGTDEIRSLGEALETMRRSLQEEELRQNRFVMGVSHDLKTPLALIKGYVELLKDGPSGSAEEREARFDLILDKADQLEEMIDHLIDYGKVATGDWKASWSTLDLGPFLEEFTTALGPDARLLGRTLEADLSLPPGAQVKCDPRSVRRCLENLVHNALRYSHPGGRVGVRAWTEGPRVLIQVWDDGPGIDPADLPRLFDPFYRGTHSRREEGLGLGLSIVQSLLDAHGWTIRAANGNPGAQFLIEAPWTQAPDRA